MKHLFSLSLNSLFFTAVIVGLSMAGTIAFAQQQEADQLRASADQSHANAQNRLGLMYYDGNGVPQDDTEAKKWFLLAAEQGNTNAQFNLGLMYYFSGKAFHMTTQKQRNGTAERQRRVTPRHSHTLDSYITTVKGYHKTT